MKIKGNYLSGGIIEGSPAIAPTPDAIEYIAPASMFKKIMRSDLGRPFHKTPEAINQLIKDSGVDTNLISDGYHTFNELYEHRIVLFVALCRLMVRDWQRLPSSTDFDKPWNKCPVWRSLAHSDGSVWDGWFILGIHQIDGFQITYHLPMSKWDECEFGLTLDCAPKYDGHTSNDVLERLKQL